jgi:hypothetical protein
MHKIIRAFSYISAWIIVRICTAKRVDKIVQSLEGFIERYDIVKSKKS